MRIKRGPVQLAGVIALPIVTITLVLNSLGLTVTDLTSRTVPGTKPAWTAAASDNGPAPTSERVQARIWLQGRDPAGLAKYAQAATDPRGPQYRRYLTPDDFAQRFGPSPAQTQAVATWAKNHQMSVFSQTDHYVAVSATVGQAEKAFAVPFHSYVLHGRRAIAPSRDVAIPDHLTTQILTITDIGSGTEAGPSSSKLPPPPKNRWWPGPCSAFEGQRTAPNLPSADGRGLTWAPCGYTPQQLRTAYGTEQSGLTGKGETIALVNAYASPTMATDLARYSRDHGEPLRDGQYREILSPVWTRQDLCTPATWYTEEAKDIEAAHGMAPEANLIYLGARDCTAGALNDTLLKVVDLHLADIVSCSWGQLTDGYGLSERLISHAIFEQGAAEGIGFYVSSGDAGYEDPDSRPGHNNGSHRLQVDYPASDPWVTAVGGTSLAINKAGGYDFETGWGQFQAPTGDHNTRLPQPPGRYPGDWTGGSGGGTSTLYEQPWYQQPVVPTALSKALPGGAASSKPMRVVPDVALDADPLTGMLVGQTVTMPDGSREYAESKSGGTSLACPLFAGIQALAEQAQHGHAIGFANPALYLRSGTAAYHDVTDTPLGADHPVAWAVHRYTDQRDRRGPVITYLATTGRDGEGAAALRSSTGYDNVTGLGSPTRYYLDSYQ